MNKEKNTNSNIQKIIYFLAGLSDFLMGYALYFMFKDDKTKKYQVELIQKGASVGLAVTVVYIIFAIIQGLIA